MISLRPTRAWSSLMRLGGRDLWQRRLDQLGAGRRAAVTAVRIGAVVARGFGRHDLGTRAGSLTYVTMFSLVPTLAVAFAMFSAFGGLGPARELLLDRLMAYLAAGVRQEVTQSIERMLENINGGAIGATGLLFVILAVYSLLSSIEAVFNDIWGVQLRRSFLERLTLYWTVVTVSPTLIAIGMSLPALLRRLIPLRWVLERTGTFDLFFGIVIPWLFVVVGFAVLYFLMIAKKIPPGAALVGGAVGGSLWFAGAHAYGWYAASTVYYVNIYGSLAAIPVFIFWIYLSWLVVFIGAQAAFAWQNLDRYREEILAAAPSQASREHVALRLVAEAARRFVHGEPPLSSAELAAQLCISVRMVNEATEQLIALGLLTEVGGNGDVLLSCDPRHLSPPDVLRGIRERGDQVMPRGENALANRLEELYERAAEAADGAWEDLSFADLAAAEGDSARARHRRPR